MRSMSAACPSAGLGASGSRPRALRTTALVNTAGAARSWKATFRPSPSGSRAIRARTASTGGRAASSSVRADRCAKASTRACPSRRAKAAGAGRSSSSPSSRRRATSSKVAVPASSSRAWPLMIRRPASPSTSDKAVSAAITSSRPVIRELLLTTGDGISEAASSILIK